MGVTGWEEEGIQEEHEEERGQQGSEYGEKYTVYI